MITTVMMMMSVLMSHQAKITAKESLEKRRLIDDLLAQRRLERELKDFDYDLDDDDLDDED